MKHFRIPSWLFVIYAFGYYAVLNHALSLLPLHQQANHRRTVLYAQPKNDNKSNNDKITESFLTELQESLQQKTFCSITLYGPSKATLKKIPDTEQTRGCLIRITGRLIQVSNKQSKRKTTGSIPSDSSSSTTQFQATFKYHLATDICKNWPLSSVTKSIRSLLESSTAYQQENSSLFDPNVLVPSEWGAPPQSESLRLHTATLETATTQYQLDLRSNTLSQHAIPTTASTTATTTTPQPHDRSKSVPLSSEAPMWQALGILNGQGKPRANMASKYKQCQTFVQLLAQRIPLLTAEETSLTKKGIRVMDMGCGRGYLTFALHHYLSEQQQSGDRFTVHSVGMDVRPKLVQEIQGIADGLGPPFDTLQFVTSTIEEYTQTAPQRSKRSAIDEDEDYKILIALHACDTATDDALYAGIQREMDLLVVAPCCHRQVRPQLDAFHATSQQQHALADLWQYNTYRERHAESITDTLRALLLEWAGYQVQVFEFIGGEHTSKNVMITAVRAKSVARTEDKVLEMEQRIQSLAMFHGIQQQALAQHLGVSLVPGKESVENVNGAGKRSRYGLPQ